MIKSKVKSLLLFFFRSIYLFIDPIPGLILRSLVGFCCGTQLLLDGGTNGCSGRG
jgi:hypothetical protein